MAQSLKKTKAEDFRSAPPRYGRVRSRRLLRTKANTPRSKNVEHELYKPNAATKASSIQLHEENRELVYSSIALSMKAGLLAIGVASLLKLGVSSNQIRNRHIELSSVLRIENLKFEKLHLRFDRLFSIGGKSRLIDEQVQWIEPNSIRVIWR